MGRHQEEVDRRARRARAAVVAVVWLAGLVAGFYALLSVAVRYGCGASDNGLACGNGGSSLGALLVITVVAVVTAVTVLAATRTVRATALLSVGAILALVLVYVGAQSLLQTV